MAFTKAPSQSTYQTKDVMFTHALSNRDQAGTKDTIAVNGYFDLIKSPIQQGLENTFTKRSGTTAYGYTIPSTNIRGLYFWKDQDKLFVSYDDKIAVITGSTGALVTTVTPFLTTTGDVGFTEFQYAVGTVKLCVTDGSRLITIDTANTVVTGADPDMPTTFNPHIVYLDGYIFMVKDGTADIYNSDLDDPLAWTPGNFITAEMLPDSLIRVARLNNYIVAFGSGSIEYFYDAGNASGSPLNRNDTPMKQVGYVGGLSKYMNKIYFIGKTLLTDPEVIELEDFKMKTIDSPPLRRYLDPYSAITGNIISYGGKDFYVVAVGTITYQMDLDTTLWTRLAQGAGSTFPINHSMNLVVTGVGNVTLVAVASSGTMLYFNQNVYQDNLVDFTATVQTESLTFDSYHKKYMGRAIVVAESWSSAATLDLSYTDDDYLTFSTPRSVNLNAEISQLTRLGKFRERAFKVTMTGNFPMRLSHLEVDYNIGGR